MTTTPHKNILLADTHPILGLGPYTSVLLRQGATVTAGDVGKVAAQTVSGVTTLWYLLSQSGGVPTWIQINTSADSGGTPLTIITSVAVRAWLRADLGVTIGTGVSNWVDQTSNAYSFAQATGSAQPVRTASDSTLNNLPTITTDGVSQFLANTSGIVIGASYWMCLVMKQVTWTASGRRILESAGGSGRNSIEQNSSTPSILLYENGSFTSVNNSATVGAWKRVTAQESNATTDGLLVGASTVSGTALGRVASTTGLTLGGQPGGTLLTNVAFAELIITDGIPNSTEKTNIDAYLQGRYGLSSLFT